MSAPRSLMTQITFIHSTLSGVRINFCIDRKGFQLFLPCGVSLVVCALVQCVFDNCPCALASVSLFFRNTGTSLQNRGFYPRNQRVSQQ